jgi:hypothetical protein
MEEKMSWYKISFPLGDAGLNSKAMQFQQEYLRIFITSVGLKKGALLLANRDEDYEYYIYYASPGAVAIAKPLILAYGGTPCSAPLREKVSLAVGDVNELDRMLPKGGSS